MIAGIYERRAEEDLAKYCELEVEGYRVTSGGRSGA